MAKNPLYWNKLSYHCVKHVIWLLMYSSLHGKEVLKPILPITITILRDLKVLWCSDSLYSCSTLFFVGGCNIEGEEDGWDFGTGAGFYVNATQDKWKNNYRMYSYVTEEVHSRFIRCAQHSWLSPGHFQPHVIFDDIFVYPAGVLNISFSVESIW